MHSIIEIEFSTSRYHYSSVLRLSYNLLHFVMARYEYAIVGPILIAESIPNDILICRKSAPPARRPAPPATRSVSQTARAPIAPPPPAAPPAPANHSQGK